MSDCEELLGVTHMIRSKLQKNIRFKRNNEIILFN